MLVDDEAVGETKPRRSRTLPARGDEPSLPNAIMCSLRMLAPALVPATCMPVPLRVRISFGRRRAAEDGRDPQLVAAGENTPLAVSSARR
jgi:hypothetical protein